MLVESSPAWYVWGVGLRITLKCDYDIFLLLRCLWKRREVVVYIGAPVVSGATRPLVYPSPPQVPAINQVRTKVNSLPWNVGLKTPIDMPPPLTCQPLLMCPPMMHPPDIRPSHWHASPHWCATPSCLPWYGDGGSEIPWPLGPNLQLYSSVTSLTNRDLFPRNSKLVSM